MNYEDPDDERLRTALHEAGHVYAAEVLGRQPFAVVLLGDRDGQTHHFGAAAPTDTWERLRTAATRRDEGRREELVIFVAGVVALEMFGYPNPAIGADGDLGRARAIAGGLVHLDAGTVDVLGSRVDAIDAILAEAGERAGEILRARYQEVLRLAETLRVNWRLAGNDLSVALEAAANGWPTPRFDGGQVVGSVLSTARDGRSETGSTVESSFALDPDLMRYLAHRGDWRSAVVLGPRGARSRRAAQVIQGRLA
jgi:hypothetical protein